MYEIEKDLFGKALADVVAGKIDAELENCGEVPDCSREHIRRVKYILKHGTLPRYRRISKRTWAIIIAAALLLTGCAVAAREQIAGFLVTILDTRNVVETPLPSAEYPTTIEEMRFPHVLPEGYELVDEVATEYTLYLTWNNAEGESIVYFQIPHENLRMSVDNEYGQWQKKNICDRDLLFYSNVNGEMQYIWMDDYIYHVYSSHELTQQEIENIIQSTKKSEN